MNSFTQEQITAFEKSIAYMERLIGVYNWPSCNEIRAYLTIYGKMKASELTELLDLQGEKSIYKSLSRLVEAKLVTKVFEPGAKRNAYYVVTRHTVNDPEFSPDFISYLIERDQYQLISDYLTSANRASIGFIEVMTTVMQQRIIEAKDPALGSNYIDSTMFIETILSLPDPEPLLQKIGDFIRSEFPKHINHDYDPSKGVEHPAAFFLAFVPLTQMKQ